jgi:DNA adenine methylase
MSDDKVDSVQPQNPGNELYDEPKPTPFLKWAGGKSQLLAQFETLFPERRFAHYFEPFVGSGAVFFALYNQGRISQAALSDRNPELINCYSTVREQPEALIEILGQHHTNHNRDYYYQIRALDRQDDVTLAPVERAARMIYLNRTCYNGLWRVNRKGQFNVPMGSYKNPRILNAPNLRAVSRALQGVSIIVMDFRRVVDAAQPGDFVYFDPPYVPLNATSNFTSYTAGNFSLDDQRDLADTFAALDRRGVSVMLSNSDTPLVRELYAAYQIREVKAARLINSKANGRGEISELVITNY